MRSGGALGAPFDAPGPRWFTIPAHRPFLEDLAAGLIRALAGSPPEEAADWTVLTPNRRAARSLAEAFVAVGGGRARLLPQIRPLGDLEEGEPPFEPGDLMLDLPPAISPLKRRLELARLVAAHPPAGRALDAAATLELADSLAAFLDSVQAEEVEDLSRIDGLVGEDQARHWKVSADFLGVATRLWPTRLQELGLIDSTARRVILLRRLAERWDRDPPQSPLIAAGSTGTAKSTADLLNVIARAPNGCVVLPGLDLDLAEDAWAQVDEQHPQGAMKRLLQRHELTRADVRPWPAGEGQGSRGRSRRRLINEALRPADATADWLGQIGVLKREAAQTGVDPLKEGLEGLSLVSTRNEAEAAAVIALLLREALETPGKTCALVTPDIALSRRVAARLARFGLAADISAGSPLIGYPVGVLLSLVARLAVDPMDPPRLLAVLKHPLARLGEDDGAHASGARTLERYGLRGPRPHGWAELRAKVTETARRTPPDPDRETRHARAAALLEVLERALAPVLRLAGGAETSVDVLARALTETVEALAQDGRGSTGGLWGGAAGEAAASLLAGLITDGPALPPATASDFAELLESLLASEIVRTGGATHPRLRILGAIEGRLVRTDLMVLAGLEEGVWPRGAPIDPFLSRPMRARLGLPAPERRIGLSAHDFAQAACASEVVLVHSERREGQPAVKSRWLWRLETLARGAEVTLPTRDDALGWARAIDVADAAPELERAKRPAPTPPVAARPRELPVTRVEEWVRDPYAVYARHILHLRQMDRPDERPEARLRGTEIHKAVEQFAAWFEERPDAEGAAAHFAKLYCERLTAAGMPASAMVRERPLALRIGEWLTEMETRRRALAERILVEAQGRIAFEAPAGEFVLTARADRLEVEEGRLHVLDFKTGRPPSLKEIRADFAPQLTLTAAIAARGGFSEIGPTPPGDLIYVRLSGRTPPGEETICASDDETEVMAQAAFEGLQGLVARYDDPNQPYRSRIAPRFVKARVSDYDHLARVREWSTGGDEEEGE